MKTILVIDDNQADQFYSEIIINNALGQVKILKALDGEAALKVLEQCDTLPDLILLDINMPRMNGHEFLEAFCAGGEREIPVVIMLTSSGQEEDKRRAEAFRCVKRYQIKPITEEDVKSLIQLVDELTADNKKSGTA